MRTTIRFARAPTSVTTEFRPPDLRRRAHYGHVHPGGVQACRGGGWSRGEVLAAQAPATTSTPAHTCVGDPNPRFAKFSAPIIVLVGRLPIHDALTPQVPTTRGLAGNSRGTTFSQPPQT